MILIFSIGGRCCSVHPSLSVLLSSSLCIHCSLSLSLSLSLSHTHTYTHTLPRAHGHTRTLSLCLSFSSLYSPLYILSNSFIPPPFPTWSAPLCCTASPSLSLSLSLCLSLSLFLTTHSLSRSRSHSSTYRQRERGDERGAHMWGSPELPGQGRTGEERRRRGRRRRRRRRRGGGGGGGGGGGIGEILQWPASFSLSLSLSLLLSLSHCFTAFITQSSSSPSLPLLPIIPWTCLLLVAKGEPAGGAERVDQALFCF